MYRRFFKRMIDLVLSALGLIVLSPLFLFIAIAIKLDDPGPVFFRQKRAGKNREPFDILKFRTMKTDAPHDMPTYLLDDPDKCITRVGRFLRKTSLDELPQLIQILTGKMSIIGPRPVVLCERELLDERDKYGANTVCPGLSGWAQINGRDELDPVTKARFDGEYVQNISFLFDCKCFFKTIEKVFRCEDVVEGSSLRDFRRMNREGKKDGMKILVVYQHYKPEPFRISDVCETLADQGHEVTVVTGVPNYPMGEVYPGYKNKHTDEYINGVHVHRCALHPRKHGIVHRIWNYYSFVFSSKKYCATLLDDYDVVYLPQTSPVMMSEAGLMYAKKHGKRSVLYCMDLWPESLTAGGIQVGSPIYRLFLRVSQKIYGQADRIMISSRNFFEYFRDTLQLPTDNLRYVPQYAETLFDGVCEKKAHEPPYHFVFAGNVGELQSVETIIEAARLLQDDFRVQFHIVGDGISLKHCQELAEGLPNVTFYGRLDVSRMPEFYEMADAMLLTLKDKSTSAYTLPGKTQSYMAAGRAIVAAANGETADVIAASRSGVCVPAEDARALADAVREFASHPEQMLEYGENGRRYYHEMFSKEAFFEKLTEELTETPAGPKVCMEKAPA